MLQKKYERYLGYFESDKSKIVMIRKVAHSISKTEDHIECCNVMDIMVA